MSKTSKIVLTYIVCGFLTFGMVFNHVTVKSGETSDKAILAFFAGATWPVVVGCTLAIWVTRYP